MPCVRGIKVRHLTDLEIEDLADQYHRRYGRCSVDEAVNMERVLEELDGRSIKLPAPFRGSGTIVFASVETLPTNVVGRTTFDAANQNAVIELPDAIYERARKGEYFARATIPHELFHVKRHMRELVNISALTNDQFSLARATSKHPNRSDSEWQAERFAPAFIAPAEGLRHLKRQGKLTRYDVQRIYRMPANAAAYRIRDFTEAENTRRSIQGQR